MQECILIVKRDPVIADFIRRGLSLEGYRVEIVYDGREGLNQARQLEPDLVILGAQPQRMNGLRVCRRLREFSDVPVIMVSGKEAVPGRAASLEAGVDDYLAVPFAFDELVARVRAQLRRHRTEAGEVLRFAGLRLYPAAWEAYRGDRRVRLTAREFKLLELFIRHPGEELTRDTIYKHVWGGEFDGASNMIEVCIHHLRSKLEAGGEPRLIQTVRGVGYTLRRG